MDENPYKTDHTIAIAIGVCVLVSVILIFIL